MNIENSDHGHISEKKDFLVNSASLKDVRSFSREVFGKLKLNDDLKEELVLAIAEAAQNIVKHAYKDVAETKDRMVVRISCNNNLLEIHFLIKANLLKKRKSNIGQLMILNLEDWVPFLYKKLWIQ